MSKWNFTKGLHDLGNGAYAYLQPDGSLGLSNAGLVVEGEKSLLVDTLFDLSLTQEMLDTMKAETKAADSIDILVNTHANGDHCYGNQLVAGAEIIASKSCVEEMKEANPQVMAQVVEAASGMGEVGEYMARGMGRFDFKSITLTLPTRTFEKSLDIKLGNKDVKLIEVGPAHTRGDVLVYVPGARALYAGDILFTECTPIMWAGPVGNWIAACDLILGLDVDAVVPGHGPITDKKGVSAVRNYFEYIGAEARKRYDAGMSVAEASMDIDLGEYSDWLEAERVVINIDTLYREFSGDTSPANTFELFELMIKISKNL